jgi:Ca2+-binding RTX toxin-like protein
MSTIDVHRGTTDFSGFVYSGVNLIRFVEPDTATAIFDGSQFDGLQIRDTVKIEGQDANGTIVVNNAVDFDASAWDVSDFGVPFVALIMLNGTSSSDSITGSAQNDVIEGGSGKDLLFGGGGRDTIDGGDGRDRISGGPGLDTLSGGAGADTFIYTNIRESAPSPRDSITDFKPGKDIIDLSAIDAVRGGSDDSFHFIGSAPFSGVAGELRYTPEHAPTFIAADVDGDGLADFGIALSQHRVLTATDFIL